MNAKPQLAAPASLGPLMAFGLCLLACAAGHGPVLSETPPVPTEREYVFARYTSLRTNHFAHPENTEAAWKFSEICFNRAELASNDSERATVAMEGIAAARGILNIDPTNAPALLCLGLNLGQLAQTRFLTALGLVKEMESAFKASIAADEKFDYAAAHRSLGMLYHQAPGWPTSIGSKSKARKHLQKTVEIAPEYPDNHLSLLEALIDWKDKDDLQRALAEYRKIAPKARKEFTGGKWFYYWMSWDDRLKTIERRAKELEL